MVDPQSDSSPLISAAASCKLRLVRLLVEGGAQVNRSNPRGETPLLAACKALRGEPAGPAPLRLLTYLLQNKADPNARDRAGRTALMYACMERAGAQVASALLAAGADPSVEDHSGASALVYAINGQHRATLKVLVDACRARGRDIIIIATETGVNGGPVTRHYLNVPPCPDTSPVPCMSPSDIVLRTGSPSSPDGENVFNFRGASRRGSSSSIHPPLQPSPPGPPRPRMWSEPWLAIHNLARLNRTYEEGVRERSLREEADREDRESRRQGGGGGGGGMGDEEERNERRTRCGGGLPRLSQSVLSLVEATPDRCLTPGGWTSDDVTPRNGVEKLPARLCPNARLSQEHPPFPHGGPSPASPPALSRPIPLRPPASNPGFRLQKQEHGVPASPAQLLSSLLFAESVREAAAASSAAARLLRDLRDLHDLRDLPGRGAGLLLQREEQEVTGRHSVQLEPEEDSFRPPSPENVIL